MILAPVVKMELEEVNNLPESIRGKGGFGQQVNENKIK